MFCFSATHPHVRQLYVLILSSNHLSSNNISFIAISISWTTFGRSFCRFLRFLGVVRTGRNGCCSSHADEGSRAMKFMSFVYGLMWIVRDKRVEWANCSQVSHIANASDSNYFLCHLFSLYVTSERCFFFFAVEWWEKKKKSNVPLKSEFRQAFYIPYREYTR